MARPEQPRRRFAPEPIETTFSTVKKGNGKQSRRIGPNPELTPEPSPRSPSPEPMELIRPRRRFAPQLIETSRRSRKRGDKGPATRPTDKTDITPYTRNIYTATKHRGRRRWGDEHPHEDYNDHHEHRPMPPTRRETEEDAGREYLLELAAKEAERQMQEVALLAFPNSHVREGNVDHFYFRESSDSDQSSEVPSPNHQRHRRKSSDLAQNWWHKHMREHASHLDQDEMAVDEPAKKDEDTVMHTDSDLDNMDLPMPPDLMWTTTNKQDVKTPGPIGESLMPLIQADPYVTGHPKDKPAQPVAAPPRPIGESPMPYIPSAPTGKPADVPYAKASQIPPDTGFRNSGPFGRPFGGLGYKPPASKYQPRPKQVSPPMLGKDLKFRRCPSPKQTKLEPDHPFAALHAEEKHRDLSGKGGLWRGYCFRSESNDGYLVPADLHAPQMMATPMPPATPGDPESNYGSAISDEPTSLLSPAEHRVRNGQPKGLHMLHGLDERLKKEKAQAELDEKIQQEFNDAFVTQVYNYLSLGYPATARAFDDELSKISLMGIDELERDDEKRLAKGHLLEADDATPREQRCPRWTALRTYITEWARQHPNLDNLEPTAWGVRERRGSWAI
ncbi:Fc.00g032360.m01.CDS01 [Cosmosporella sp. VM-42]